MTNLAEEAPTIAFEKRAKLAVDIAENSANACRDFTLALCEQAAACVATSLQKSMGSLRVVAQVFMQDLRAQSLPAGSAAEPTVQV